MTFPFFESMYDPRYRAIHRQLDAFWAERGTPHLDLLGVYDGIPTEELIAHRYDTHPNEEAHRLAAESIERELLHALQASKDQSEASSQM